MKFNYTIRKVERADLPQVFQLEEEAFKPNHYPLFVLTQFYDTFPDLFFVAVDGSNQIKGYCLGGINDSTNMGWIYALAVVKAAQNRKLGFKLTTQLITAFKDKSIQSIQLTTSTDNSAAINLYQKLGFKIVTETTDYYFDNMTRFVMRLEER